MIVCLGWGSLIWNPGTLKIKDGWKTDGPKLAVEYLRQSQKGQLTLVIDKQGNPFPVLWVEMDFENLDDAKENLRMREGQIKRSDVGCWKAGDCNPDDIAELDVWASSIGATSVIWTGLPPKFNGTNFQRPSLEEAIQYLENLDSGKKELAEEYITQVSEFVLSLKNKVTF